MHRVPSDKLTASKNIEEDLIAFEKNGGKPLICKPPEYSPRNTASLNNSSENYYFTLAISSNP